MTVSDRSGEVLPPLVVEGEVVISRRVSRSPLDGGGHRLTGGVVTDPREVAGIASRVAHYRMSVWRRWWRRPGNPLPARATYTSRLALPAAEEVAV